MIFGNEEKRIVTEASAAAELAHDLAVAASFHASLHHALRVRQGCNTDVISRPAVVEQRCQFSQEPRIVGRVAALLARVPGRIHTGAAVERRHD